MREYKLKTMTKFDDFTFEHLNKLQVGKIGEYWAKIWMTFAGFDIYTTDVDDKGIDFIIRIDSDNHIDVQVKTIRNTGYVYVPKETWKSGLRENLNLVLVLLKNNEMPSVYFIPSKVWENPTVLFTDRNYEKEGQISKPEWGINISQKNMEELEQYEITKFIAKQKSRLR
jgi:hypothetical protein